MKNYYLTFFLAIIVNSMFSQELKYLDNNIGISQQDHKFVDSIILNKINCRLTKTFSVSDKLRLERALIFLDSVIESDKFKKYVMSYRFKNRKRKNTKGINGILVSNYKIDRKKKLTNEEILNLIKTGDDRLGRINDGILDIYLEHREIKANGVTKNGMITIRTSRLQKDKDWEIAGTILHEYGHVLGFSHFSNKRWIRSIVLSKNDVAYGFGKIIYNFKK